MSEFLNLTKGFNPFICFASSHKEHIGFGLFALFCNLIVLAVFFTNKKFLRKSSFMVGLAVGDLCQGFSIFLQGVLLQLDKPTTVVEPLICMTRATPWILFGSQISGFMFFLFDIERFIAVRHYAWYRRNWTYKLSWRLTTTAYSMTVISVMVAYVVIFFVKSSWEVTISCHILEAIGFPYGLYHYCVMFIGGLVAIAGTFIAMVCFSFKRKQVHATTSKRSNVTENIQFQWQICKTMLCISVCDISFVVLPNFVALLPSFGMIMVDTDQLLAWPLKMGCIRVSLNLLLYFLINAEFRHATYKSFPLNFSKNGKGSSVIQIKQGQRSSQKF